MWTEGAKTDRAVELLRNAGAKTNDAGEVVPAHRYSRDLRAVAHEALWDMGPWGPTEFSIWRQGGGDRWGVACSIRGEFGGAWSQHGEWWSDEGVSAYDCSALTICRALLNYSHKDGTLMTEDEVIAMLEERRRDTIRQAEEASCRRLAQAPVQESARHTSH